MSVQRQVARTVSDATCSDPLRELATLEDFALFLKREGASEAECSRHLNLLSKRGFVAQAREEEKRETQPEEPQREVQLVHDDRFSRAEPGTNLEHGQISRLGLKPARSETTFTSFVRARILPCGLLLSHSRRRLSTLPVFGHSHAPEGTILADLQALRALGHQL